MEINGDDRDTEKITTLATKDGQDFSGNQKRIRLDRHPEMESTLPATEDGDKISFFEGYDWCQFDSIKDLQKRKTLIDSIIRP